MFFSDQSGHSRSCWLDNCSTQREVEHFDTNVATGNLQPSFIKIRKSDDISKEIPTLTFSDKTLKLSAQGNQANAGQKATAAEKHVAKADDERGPRRDGCDGDSSTLHCNEVVGFDLGGSAGRGVSYAQGQPGNADPSPTPTLSQIAILAGAAGDDHGALVDMAYSSHLSDEGAHQIASHALDAAIEDGGCDISQKQYAAALTLLLAMGWAARERKQQDDIGEGQDIWIGAARAEARREAW